MNSSVFLTVFLGLISAIRLQINYIKKVGSFSIVVQPSVSIVYIINCLSNLSPWLNYI